MYTVAASGLTGEKKDRTDRQTGRRTGGLARQLLYACGYESGQRNEHNVFMKTIENTKTAVPHDDMQSHLVRDRTG